MALAGFPETFTDAANELKPGEITTYANNLSDKFNSFYAAHPVLKAETPGSRGRGSGWWKRPGSPSGTPSRSWDSSPGTDVVCSHPSVYILGLGREILEDQRLNLIKLRLSMLGTLALIIGVSTLGLATLLAYTGGLNVYSLATVVIIFNAAQWLLAPYLVNSSTRCVSSTPRSTPGSTASSLTSRRVQDQDAQTHDLHMAIPNAFAYGSPPHREPRRYHQGAPHLLEGEEVEAVLAHELGHIKHRDVPSHPCSSASSPASSTSSPGPRCSPRYGNRDRRNGGGLAASR